jgi:hypothetical protein
MSPSFQQTNTLELLQDRLQILYTQNDKLDQRAQNNIEAITVLLALSAAFKLLELQRDGLNQIIIVFVFVLYTLSVLLSIYVLLPKLWLHPLDPNINQINQVSAQPEEAYYQQLLIAYTRAIRVNEGVVNLKARVVWWSTILIGADILLVLFLAAKG